MFDTNDKQRINNFITKINEVELKDKNINFEYDLTDYDNKRLIGTTYDCPRGNSTSEKWTDRMLSDTFTLVDIITYKLHHKNSLIGHLMFAPIQHKKFQLIEKENPDNKYDTHQMKCVLMELSVDRLYFHFQRYYPKLLI